MSHHIEIQPDDFLVSPFRLIGKDWMLIAAEKNGRTNAMTASWGGLGVMWGKNVAFVVIRPQRYTREFVEASPAFSLNFFDAAFREQLAYFGKVSGRDEDKVAKTGLTVRHAHGAPYFVEASSILLCGKLYSQSFREECFLDHDAEATWYPQKDFHQLYIAEILGILGRNP